MHAAAQLADGRVRGQQVLRGDAPDGQHDARAQQRDLAFQVRQAVGHLLGRGIAVVGRPALEHVGDEHLSRAAQPDARSIELSSCPARPTNGSPCRSSSAPGASPTTSQLGAVGRRRRTRSACACSCSAAAHAAAHLGCEPMSPATAGARDGAAQARRSQDRRRPAAPRPRRGSRSRQPARAPGLQVLTRAALIGRHSLRRPGRRGGGGAGARQQPQPAGPDNA